jgi:hypothetical protein
MRSIVFSHEQTLEINAEVLRLLDKNIFLRMNAECLHGGL